MPAALRMHNSRLKLQPATSRPAQTADRSAPCRTGTAPHRLPSPQSSLYVLLLRSCNHDSDRHGPDRTPSYPAAVHRKTSFPAHFRHCRNPAVQHPGVISRLVQHFSRIRQLHRLGPATSSTESARASPQAQRQTVESQWMLKENSPRLGSGSSHSG